MIKKETIRDIMTAARIDEVVNDYVTLKKRGANLIGLCPFHNEKTPSFTVSPSKNFYKCFGCGKGGDVVNFLMEHEKFTYPEALRFLAARYNILIEEVERDEQSIAEEKHRESLILINEIAKDYFVNQLLHAEEGQHIGLSYFKHRGLLDSTIERFSLGYAPKDKKSLTDYAIRQGYNEELLKEIGLTTNSGIDFFRERVIFPFFNLSGKVIGFGGRVLNDHLKTAKYINSPETALYNKRKTLYGLYQAKGEIRKEGYGVLVEGYTDVLSLYQNGIKNVVASSGTSLTVEQVRLIKRFTDQVIVIYDGDQAGQNAALRSLDIFLDFGLNVQVVVLPSDADPDSYIRDVGATAFTEYLKEKGKDFLLLQAENIEASYAHDPVKKSIHLKDLIQSLSKISDPIKRSLYIKECAAIVKLDEVTLVKEINRTIRSIIQRRRRVTSRPEVMPDLPQERVDHSQGARLSKKQLHYQERDVVRVLLQGGHLPYDESENNTVGEYVISNIFQIIDLFESELYKSVIKEYADLLSRQIHPAREHFVYHEKEEIRKLAIDLLFDPYSYANWSERGVELQTQKPKEENYYKDSLLAILRFKLLKINQRIGEIDEIIRSPDREITEALLVAKMKLQEERKTLADQLGVIVL